MKIPLQVLQTDVNCGQSFADTNQLHVSDLCCVCCVLHV